MVDTDNLFDSEAINSNCKNSAELYEKVAKAAEKIVLDSYAVEEDGRVNPSFPIDIGLIARHFNITVNLTDLDLDEPQFSRVLAVLIRHNDNVNILVDDKVGYKTRRYATANAIARYLLKNQTSVFTSSYAIPLIPQSLEEVSADMIALFMLMPVDLFKKEFKEYIENTGDRPLNVDRWLEYLSDRTQISPFNLAIGYQQMKMVLCYERQKELSENKNLSGEEDPYAMIFA